MDQARFVLFLLLIGCLLFTLGADCQRPGHEPFCDTQMDLAEFDIEDVVLGVSPLLPDENSEISGTVTFQLGTRCHVETIEICGVRLVDRATEEVLVELNVSMSEEFDGVLPCYPSRREYELVDDGTPNSAVSPFCLRELNLVVEMCSVDCDGHSWSGSGRVDLECF